MALSTRRPFQVPNRRSPVFQYGVLLFIQPGDHTQRVEIQRALDSGGSPGTYTTIATVGPLPRGGGYHIDERPNTTGLWWYRARHEAGYQYSTAGAYTTLATAVAPRQVTKEDLDRLGNDAYPAPQATVSVNTDGTADFSVDGDSWVASYRYLSSKSAFPSDASTIATGTINSNRQFTRAAIETLEPGETCFVTLVPFSATGATGTQGESIHVRATFNPTDIPQGTIAIDESGNVEVTVDGPQWVASYKFAGSTIAFPTEATVRSSGTTQNGRQISISSASFSTLALGDTIFVTILPYSATGAGGTEGPAIKLRATRHDASATKTLYFNASSIVPYNALSSAHYEYSGGALTTRDWASVGSPFVIALISRLEIPSGVTITSISTEAYDDAGATSANVMASFRRATAANAVTTLATSNSSPTGWQTLTNAISDSSTGQRYYFYWELDVGASGDIGLSRISGYSVTYTMPSTANTV